MSFYLGSNKIASGGSGTTGSASETSISNLKLNYLTEEQYKTALAAGEINENELYFTPDDTAKKLLWSGTCKVGDTVTLNENVNNFRFIVLRYGNQYNILACPVIPNIPALRGSLVYGQTTGADLINIRGTHTGTTFTLDYISAVVLRTTGTTVSTSVDNITQIWGIR